MGDTTVAATTSALAPGYWPETVIVGGAISGYCATGRREKETPPRMTMMIDTTAAKIGLSMKKCERRMVATDLFCRGGGRAGAFRRGCTLFLRRHLDARTDPH